MSHDASSPPLKSGGLDQKLRSPIWSGAHWTAHRAPAEMPPQSAIFVPTRYVVDWLDLTHAEQVELRVAVREVKAQLQQSQHFDRYHLHINAGDHPLDDAHQDDSRLNIRLIPSAKRNQTLTSREASRLARGGTSDPLIKHLRPWLSRATRVEIVAAFVRESGVSLLESEFLRSIERGAHVRVITGDYLQITQSQALHRLLDWSSIAETADAEFSGSIEVRIVESVKLEGRSFHPKSWSIETRGDAIAWVGSSNWSRMALQSGVEWNLCVSRSNDFTAYQEIKSAFMTLWETATPLTSAWVSAYEARALSHELRSEELTDSEPQPIYEPIGVQPEALQALAQARQEGRTRALVVLATGLGKTFLAAFDARQLTRELGRTIRVLFIAHRRELLIQASKTFRRVFPEQTQGFFVGGASNLNANLVFASIQKLARVSSHLDPMSHESPLRGFDYVIVDESHHAPASSYRRVLELLDAHFLLGLTATPERADAHDVASLFDDHIAYRADLGKGIEVGRLVPFDYAGLPDTINFEPIPWRQYSADQLASLAETEERMTRVMEAWDQYKGTRTIVFCVTIRHADYVTQWLRARGVRIAAIHTGAKSAHRTEALDQLASGHLDAIAAVDLLNEGVDIPTVDRVVMLRPTGSPVVFLQQLGRGLRVAEGKERLQVIDFIGNHKVFLGKLRTLLSLSNQRAGDGSKSLSTFLRSDDGYLELASGCRAQIQLEVIDMLSQLITSSDDNETVRVYRELRDARDERPTPGELARMGLNPNSVGDEGWFAFVQDEGDLNEFEVEALSYSRKWFKYVSKTSMKTPLEMLTLDIMLRSDALFEGLSPAVIATRVHAMIARDPDLRVDLDEADIWPQGTESSAWRAYFQAHSLSAWVQRGWFTLRDDHFVFKHTAPQGETRVMFLEMSAQLVDLRLTQYRRRRMTTSDRSSSSFVCKVWHNKRHPILKLPDRASHELPFGETDVCVDDGRIWQFRLQKIACNVARPVGAKANELSALLYRWFGSSAGRSGTDQRVRFWRTPDGWRIKAVRGISESDRPRPAQGSMFADIQHLIDAFRLSRTPKSGLDEVDDQVFLTVDNQGSLLHPHQLIWELDDEQSAQVAHIIVCTETHVRYAGIGRRKGHLWTFPEVDFQTWRTLGKGRRASRTLDSIWTSTAKLIVTFMIDNHQLGDWIEGYSRRCRFQGRTSKGGIRIDHEDLKPRTVSETDLAWVLQADHRREENGGLMDEAWVNSLRYLEGTPKASTRWIDTGWALTIVAHAQRLGFTQSHTI